MREDGAAFKKKKKKKDDAALQPSHLQHIDELSE